MSSKNKLSKWVVTGLSHQNLRVHQLVVTEDPESAVNAVKAHFAKIEKVRQLPRDPIIKPPWVKRWVVTGISVWNSAIPRRTVSYGRSSEEAWINAMHDFIQPEQIRPAGLLEWRVGQLILYVVILVVMLITAMTTYSAVDYYWITGPKASNAKYEREYLRDMIIERHGVNGADPVLFITSLKNDHALVEHSEGVFSTSLEGWLDIGEANRLTLARMLRGYVIQKYNNSTFILKDESGGVLASVDENTGKIAITVYHRDEAGKIDVLK